MINKKNLILVAVVIAILAAISIGIAVLVNNKSIGINNQVVAKCPACGSTNVTATKYDKNNHNVWCPKCIKGTLVAHVFDYEKIDENNYNKTCAICSYKEKITRKCQMCGSTNVTILQENNNVHKVKCLNCSTTQSVAHEPWINGKCVWCGYSCKHEKFDENRCTTCGYICVHDYEYEKISASYHTKTCKKCGNKVAEIHDDIIYSKKDETMHYAHCRTCKKQWEEVHKWNSNGSCENCGKICAHNWVNGKCTYCQSGCNHNWKETGEYLYRGDGRHSKKLECSACGLVKTDSTVSYCIVTTKNEVEPTCTKAGSTGTKYCKLCNQIIKEAEVIAPLGHDYKNATCTEPATCKKCGVTAGNALGHDYKDATCTEPATCKRCGVTAGNALGHDYKNATCTEPATCKRCGVTAGNAAGHLYVNGICTRCSVKEPVKECEHDWENTGKWSYNNNGTHSPEQKCKKCEKVRVDDEYEKCTVVIEKAVEATCTTDGKTEKQYCSKCGNIVKKSEKINALGHDYKAATCTEPARCTRCKTTTGNALDHDYKNATCTEPATCKRCGATAGNAAGHLYVNGICTRCNEKEPVKECEHDWENTGKWVYNGNNTHSPEMKCKKCGTVKIDSDYASCKNVRDDGVPATCTTEGKTIGFHCEICGNIFQEQKTIKAYGHQDFNKDGICDSCKINLGTEPEKEEPEKKPDEEPEKNPEKEPSQEEPNNPEEKPATQEEPEDIKKCEHLNKEWKIEDTKHWMICKDCGAIIQGTSGEHIYIDGKCKNCGKADTETTKDENMPNTGNANMQIIGIAIIGTIGLAGVGGYKLTKYKKD